ncbi:MAG: DUF4276 family protein [Desulfovibrio aminophilus]|uniref:DUF4276 family protein n=1 Tax=Desulfovibrio aminophilus TaxID=81425 RepID=UPI0039E8A626
MAIVEGKTEEMFVKSLLAPYLGARNIFMHATQVSKPGQKGGDVKFSRVKKDLGLHLKQRSDTYVTTLVDYYGIKEWPGIDDISPQATPDIIAQTVNEATKAIVNELFEDQRADYRFIPYMAIHEFESLLFSDSTALANELGIDQQEVDSILEQFGEPEAINNSPETAPSKRLDKWSLNGKFPKTTIGIAIAREIGIPAMRDMCPLFNEWLSTFENIQEGLE